MKIKEKEELLKKIAELQKQVDNAVIENDNPFDVKDGEKAYYVDVGYESDWYRYWTEEEIERYIPCKDEEIINKKRERERLNALLEKFAYENNANVTEDMWKNEEIKFFICKQYFNNTFVYISAVATAYQDLSTIYFISKEVAERAITEIVIPFMEEHND